LVYWRIPPDSLALCRPYGGPYSAFDELVAAVIDMLGKVVRSQAN
jgi:hypothetical protein